MEIFLVFLEPRFKRRETQNQGIFRTGRRLDTHIPKGTRAEKETCVCICVGSALEKAQSGWSGEVPVARAGITR